MSARMPAPSGAARWHFRFLRYGRSPSRRKSSTLFSTDRAVVLSGMFFAGDLFFWHLSILATTVANATFLATTAPVWVAFGAWLVFREKISKYALIGLALCLLGGSALIGQSYSFAPERLIGDGYALVTSRLLRPLYARGQQRTDAAQNRRGLACIHVGGNHGALHVRRLR